MMIGIFSIPPPRRQHFREKFLGRLFISKVPMEVGAPQSFDASYAPGRKAHKLNVLRLNSDFLYGCMAN
jgi:hypothetical protein